MGEATPTLLPGQVQWLDQVLLPRVCVMEPTTGVACRGIGLTTGIAKVWRWLNQPRRRKMVLMPTVWPTPISVPARIPQGSGRMLAAIPATLSSWPMMAAVAGQGVPALSQHTICARIRTCESYALAGARQQPLQWPATLKHPCSGQHDGAQLTPRSITTPPPPTHTPAPESYIHGLL